MEELFCEYLRDRRGKLEKKEQIPKSKEQFGVGTSQDVVNSQEYKP